MPGDLAFVVTGKGGLPLQPEEGQPAGTALVELTPLVASKEQSRSPTSTPATAATPIHEAQTWVVAEDGSVYLGFQAKTYTFTNAWYPPAKCRKDRN